MDYGQLIGQAWRLVLRNRFIWGLAVIAGCQAGAGPGAGVNWTTPAPDFDGRGRGEAFQGLEQLADGLGRWAEAFAGVLLGIAALLGLLVVAYWVVSTIAGAGIMSAVGALDEGRPTGFGHAWRQGAGAFWRFVGLVLLLGLIALIVGAVVALFLAVPLLGAQRADGAGLFLWFSVLVFLLVVAGLPLLVLASIVVTYAQRAIVLDNDGVFASLARAIALVRSRFGASLLLWLISVGLAIGVGLAVLFLLILLAIPVAIVVVVLALTAGPGAPVALGILLGLAVIAALWFAGSLGSAFLSAYWTLAYLRLTRPPAPVSTPAT